MSGYQHIYFTLHAIPYIKGNFIVSVFKFVNVLIRYHNYKLNIREKKDKKQIKDKSFNIGTISLLNT